MVDMQAINPLREFFHRLGNNSGSGVKVEVITDRGMVNLFSTSGKARQVERSLGISGKPGKATEDKEKVAIPLSPGQWLLVSHKSDINGGFAARIQDKIKKNGYVSEQSSARVMFRVSGSRARELMQKGCRLDLHPDASGENWCGQTQIAQIGVILRQSGNSPVYELYVYSGFAQDFAEWLSHTGAQLGITFKE